MPQMTLTYLLIQVYSGLYLIMQMWFGILRSKVHDIELVQNSVIWFISNMKGCTGSVSEVRSELGFWSLEDRRKTTDCFYYTDSSK